MRPLPRLQVKPDGVHRGLVGDIIQRFEQRGFKLVGIKVRCVGALRWGVGARAYSFFDFPPARRVPYPPAQVLVPSRELAGKHYAEHDGKPFFPKLVDFLSSGAVVAMVWEGKDVVATGRKMIGATNPLASPPGTIR